MVHHALSNFIQLGDHAQGEVFYETFHMNFPFIFTIQSCLFFENRTLKIWILGRPTLLSRVRILENMHFYGQTLRQI